MRWRDARTENHVAMQVTELRRKKKEELTLDYPLVLAATQGRRDRVLRARILKANLSRIFALRNSPAIAGADWIAWIGAWRALQVLRDRIARPFTGALRLPDARRTTRRR